jgi:DNA-binding beta-propeller fold protein YncE
MTSNINLNSLGLDYLYVGDGSDNTVKRFDAITGDFLGTFAKGHIKGPRGLLFDREGNLLVSNQNVDKNKNGNILKFDGQTGKFLGELVPSKGNNAPFAPRGMVLTSDNILYVADFQDRNGNPGEVRAYNGTTGAFLGVLDHSGFDGEFYPRGLVIGPDHLLYVSVLNFSSGLGGAVLRFDLTNWTFDNKFVTSDSNNDLQRPEGLVFAPNGNLYVTSFRSIPQQTNATDKILVFNGDGEFLEDETINLDNVGIGQPRAFAQAILFGPNEKLFVPITGNGPDTGSVRRYNEDKTFDVFVPSDFAKGPLGSPWYLTFGKTDPATLAYEDSTMG